MLQVSNDACSPRPASVSKTIIAHGQQYWTVLVCQPRQHRTLQVRGNLAVPQKHGPSGLPQRLVVHVFLVQLAAVLGLSLVGLASSVPTSTDPTRSPLNPRTIQMLCRARRGASFCFRVEYTSVRCTLGCVRDYATHSGQEPQAWRLHRHTLAWPS
ncbi:hypothetical protein C8Q72DRAFT_153325 [Fomitopsis betulina]|nr:hypothetical protein C8Q72DRAFT_153325 [Fomitopsis betulina]